MTDQTTSLSFISVKPEVFQRLMKEGVAEVKANCYLDPGAEINVCCAAGLLRVRVIKEISEVSPHRSFRVQRILTNTETH